MQGLKQVLVCLSTVSSASAQEVPLPIQVGIPVPQTLDLRKVDVTCLLPGEHRDPARLQAIQRSWEPILADVAMAGSIRILLPRSAERVQLMLAASQALRARNPNMRIYLAFQPELPPLMEVIAWGAVEGGALLTSDLGTDIGRWRGLLAEAQNHFPGRSWFLWVPSDPGPHVAQLLGDGARLILPEGGPGARLAQAIPPGFTEVEGGLGDLTLRKTTGENALRWVFHGNSWIPTKLRDNRHEVLVMDRNSYDVASLLAKVRATQLRDRLKVYTVQASVDVNLHVQGEGGGGDLGFRFQSFEKVGEPEELLRQEVRFNGVKAKLSGTAQLPIVEARTSVANPVALTLTERYHYRDGGAAGPGRRILQFTSVDADPMLFEGELTVDEASGRILQERSSRSNLPGMVRSERRELTYGEVTPGIWRVHRVHSAERWVSAGGTNQVLRDMDYRDFKINAPDFDADLASVRAGNGSILQKTPDGYRYFVKQADGTRKLETRARSGGKAIGGMLLMQPGQDTPVMPLAGLLLFDFNAFDRGIHYTLLTAGVFNMGSLTFPRAFLGLDLSASAKISFLGGTERPVKDGKQLDTDGVGRRSQALELGFGRDLGVGLRLAIKGQFTHDAFSDPKEDKYRTAGFLNPPSGWTRLGGGELSWQFEGFQLRGTYLEGLRPTGRFGAPGAVTEVPNKGRLARWEGAAIYDWQISQGVWFHANVGHAGGQGFDRFQPISFDDRVSGIKPYAVVADRMTYGGIGVAFPTGPSLRLTLGLDHGQARSMTDQKTYRFTGLKLVGDLPGFWWFTTVRMDLGAGLQSDVKGLRTINGTISFLHLF